MKLTQAPSFIRTVKKLHPNQKKALDKAVRALADRPSLGEAKVGDLAGIYIYKFKNENLEWLLAYRIQSKSHLTLLVVGPHENFYRDLKRAK
ncbi:Type II bacterial toxin-antitoxin system, ParE-like toxin [Candidatus Nanopelagicaceae bacterium]